MIATRSPAVVLACALLLAALAVDSLATQPDWIRDLADAQRVAQASGKDLLVAFTGQGWCGHCITLDREVFSDPLFDEETRDRFVTVELDYTFGDSAEEAKRKEMLRALSKQYLVEGFPTIVLMDAQMRPYAYFVGYEDGFGVRKYVDRIDAAQMDYRGLLNASTAERSTGEGEASSDYAQALAAVGSHIDVDDRRDDPLLLFYAAEVERAVTSLDDGDPVRRSFTSRKRNQYLRSNREATWAPIGERLAQFYSSEDWEAAQAYAVETAPTLEDPILRTQLQGQAVSFLARLQRYDVALETVQSMLTHEGLDRERRRRLENDAARYLVKLGRVDEAIAVYDSRIAAAEQAGDLEEKLWLLDWKSQMMLQTDRLEETLAVARECRELAEHGSEIWLTATYLLGIKLRQAERYDEALRMSMEQYNADPQGLVMAHIAESHVGLGHDAEARNWIELAEREMTKLRESPRIGDHDFAEIISAVVAPLREKLHKISPTDARAADVRAPNDP